MTAPINIDFTQSPTIGKALIDRANVMGIMGPVGSGKSHGCSAKIMWHAELQHIQPDGWKRARYAVIRNTGPELKSTTIKTFTAIFPEGAHGRVTYSAPITYHMKFPPRDGNHGLDIEIMFLALDNPTDVKKLLSLELTGAWVNEAREINPVIIDALTGRVGRFPSMAQGGCVQPMTWCDTNPPDEDNWWYQYFETQKEPIKFRLASGETIDLAYRLYRQPPAVLELREMSDGKFESIEPDYDYIFEREEAIPAAGTYWGINPEAENLSNLDPAYYARQLINKSRTHIQVYAQGKYGYVRTGKAVVPEFNHELQVIDLPIMRDQPIFIGVDIGGGTLTPAAVIGQVHPMGTKVIHHELCAKDMGVDNFARLLRDFINMNYSDMKIDSVYTDPAAEQRDQVFETKINEYLRAASFPVKSAPTNAWKVRRQAIADPCSRLINGKPALLIHPRCVTLINGLKGKWDFRKMKIVGAEMYADVPSKNMYSHPCDALGYFCSGLGEGQPLRNNRTPSQNAAFKAGGFMAKEGDFGL